VLGNSRKDGSAFAVIGIVATSAPAICAILFAAAAPRAADYQPRAAITCTSVITLRLVNSRMRQECVLRCAISESAIAQSDYLSWLPRTGEVVRPNGDRFPLRAFGDHWVWEASAPIEQCTKPPA
jgi:hypothetical protein